MHIAFGHPGPRLLPDLVAFRARHPGARHVVHAYEPHEHVYDSRAAAPGRVVVRGAGITASCILERLIHDRDARGAQTEILHVSRRTGNAPVAIFDGWMLVKS